MHPQRADSRARVEAAHRPLDAEHRVTDRQAARVALEVRLPDVHRTERVADRQLERALTERHAADERHVRRDAGRHRDRVAHEAAVQDVRGIGQNGKADVVGDEAGAVYAAEPDSDRVAARAVGVLAARLRRHCQQRAEKRNGRY